MVNFVSKRGSVSGSLGNYCTLSRIYSASYYIGCLEFELYRLTFLYLHMTHGRIHHLELGFINGNCSFAFEGKVVKTWPVVCTQAQFPNLPLLKSSRCIESDLETCGCGTLSQALKFCSNIPSDWKGDGRGKSYILYSYKKGFIESKQQQFQECTILG